MDDPLQAGEKRGTHLSSGWVGRGGCGLELGVSDGLLELLVLGSPEVARQAEAHHLSRGSQHVHRGVVAQAGQAPPVNLQEQARGTHLGYGNVALPYVA